MLIPFIRPSMPSLEDISEGLESIVNNNWYTNFGPYEINFRNQISKYIGDEINVVTVNNATTGLLIALSALLPRGSGTSQIAIASFTFSAGVHAINWLGYVPAWIDIDPRTLQPSAESFHNLMAENSEIKAILLSNTFGIANEDIHIWEEIAESYQIPLIIDSAAGFGSRFRNGEILGLRGDCEVFSFHATKPFAIGEGGAITARSEELAERMRSISNFGFQNTLGSVRQGLNGKLTELSSIIGLKQLERLELNLNERRAASKKYRELLKELPVTFLPNFNNSSMCFLPIVINSNIDLQKLIFNAASRGIEIRQYYKPLHEQFAFNKFPRQISLSITENIAPRVIALPLLSKMQNWEIQAVSELISVHF